MTVTRSVVLGCGSYLPNHVLTNVDIARKVDTTDQWITQRTGIRERRIAAAGEVTSDLALRAARAALESGAIDPRSIDLIVLATSTPDNTFPASAVTVQAGLGITKGAAFDLQAVCSGFVFGLAAADGLLRTGAFRRALVIGAETFSRLLDWSDRSTCVLFGDGAGAVVLEPSNGADEGILDFTHDIDGSGGPSLYMPAGGSLHPPSHETVEKRMHYVHQDGGQVFKYAVRRMADLAEGMLARNGYTKDDLALVVPHQANLRIIRAMQERLGVDDSKVMVNIDRYGNTTAATIPLGLCDAVTQGRLHKGDLVMLVSVGAGYTAGAMLLRWAY